MLSKAAESAVMGALGCICYAQIVNCNMGKQCLSKQDDSANGLSSYVCSAGGLLELYQVTGETKWLQWCQKLQTTLDELFWDQTAGEKAHAYFVSFCLFETPVTPM